VIKVWYRNKKKYYECLGEMKVLAIAASIQEGKYKMLLKREMNARWQRS